MNTKLRAAIRKRRLQSSGPQDESLRDFLSETAAEEVEKIFEEVKASMMQMAKDELKRLLSTIKKGDKGEKGDKGADSRIIVGPRGPKGDSIRGPEGKQGPPGKAIRGEKGEPGKDGSEITYRQLMTKINSIPGGVKIQSVDGLKKLLDTLERMIRAKVGEGRKHRHGGGGMTIDAGSNITLVRGSDGRWTISSASGGVNVATEAVTTVQSGDHVTIDLTQLANTSTGVLIVSKNGQMLMPNGSAGLPGSTWSQSGSTVTVYNADTSESYLIQYTYA